MLGNILIIYRFPCQLFIHFVAEPLEEGTYLDLGGRLSTKISSNGFNASSSIAWIRFSLLGDLQDTQKLYVRSKSRSGALKPQEKCELVS